MVVDYSRDGTDGRAWTPAAVEVLRTRRNQPPRTLLCYLSIGEAESYRYYWRPSWRTASPAWLGKENAEWKGNYSIHYWDDEWQRIIVNPTPSVWDRLQEWLDPTRKPYIDRILEAGCDGVYLDRIDSFSEWDKTRGAKAERDMIAFVQRISAYAKSRRPDFVVVPQNGEELLRHGEYRAAIDGVAKEDLLFGISGDQSPNDPDAISATTALLDQVKAEGKPVMVVEYLSDPSQQARAVREIQKLGYLPLIATRALNAPPMPVAKVPATEPRPPVSP